jgi:hypothetical protein
MASVLNKKEIDASPELVKRITLTDVIKNNNNMPKPTRDTSDIIERLVKPPPEVTEPSKQILERVQSQELERREQNLLRPPQDQGQRILQERLLSNDQIIRNPAVQENVSERRGIQERLLSNDQIIRKENTNLGNDRRPGAVRDQLSIFDYNRAQQGGLEDIRGQGFQNGQGLQNDLEIKKSFSNMMNKIKEDRIQKQLLEASGNNVPMERQGQEDAISSTGLGDGGMLPVGQAPVAVPVTAPVVMSTPVGQAPVAVPRVPTPVQAPLSVPQTSPQGPTACAPCAPTMSVFNIHLMCNAPTAYDFVQMDKNAKTLVAEKVFLEKFTDDQLNRIGLDRNIPDVVIYPKERKIQMILADPKRIEHINSLHTALNDLSIGDLLYVAGRENISVQLLPDRYNVRRILVALILYQRKRSDLIEYNLLTDDDLRTIVSVIQGGNNVEYSWILPRCDLEKIIDTGLFPAYSNEFVPRWRRYEILKILPQPFLQSVSFQLASSDLAMVPTDNYIISRLIDLSENPFEAIYAKHRNVDREFLKIQYGLLVPRIWDSMDYIGLNGPYYPLTIPEDPFSVDKLLSIGTRVGRREYLSQYHDLVLLQEIKNYVPYNGRLDLIENILKIFDPSEDIYFACLVPQLQGKIYYGNYTRSEVYSPDTLASKLDFLATQNYPLEDKIEITKKTRQLITVLLNMNMMTPKLAASISKLITTYEENSDAQPYFYAFLLQGAKEIANIRKLFYQRFYYAQTRNCLYVNMTQSDFVNKLPKLYNINRRIPPGVIEKSNDDLYDTIAYMKLFFGYIPHSIRNFVGMS